MKLGDIMIREVIQSLPEDSISEAAGRMRESAVGCLVVSASGRLRGIVTARDVLDCVGGGHDPLQCKVAVHMSRPVVVLKPQEDLLTAAAVMRRKGIKRLPVVEKGELCGIVSWSGLAKLAESELTSFQSAARYWRLLIGIAEATSPESYECVGSSNGARAQKGIPHPSTAQV